MWFLGALASFAPSAWAAPTAYVADFFSNNVSAFSIASDGSLNAISGSPFATGLAPLGVAISPDGKYLYVTDFESDGVSAFSIASDGSLSAVAGSPFTTGSGPWGVAVSPDGQNLYVANDGSDSVSAFSIASDGSLSAVAGSPFETGSAPGGMLSNGVAVSPDGQHLYVTNQGADNVTAFSIASNGSLSPVLGSPFATGETPRGVSASPDGKHLYVANESSGTISAYSIASDGSLSSVGGSPFATEGAPLGVAASPDGRHLYVAHVGGGNNVWGYSIASNGSLSAVAGSPFATGGMRSNSVAVSADSRHLYVTNNSSDNLSAFSIASNGSLSAVAGSPFAAGSGPLEVAVSPDQGPVAAFSPTPTPAGDASSFNASASSDPDGGVASYSWDFGDGQTEVTPTATTAHSYIAAGKYTVTLTTTDNAGCSTTQTFTGQTASCNGSPVAQISHQIVVPPGISLNVSLAGFGSGLVASAPSGIACPEGCSYAYEPSTQVTLAATPAPGSTFAGWSGGGCSGTGACQVELNADTDVIATFNKFAPLPNHALTVKLAGSGKGSVGDDVGAISCPFTCSHAYVAGTQVTLTATPARGSTFAGWSGGGCADARTCQFAIGADTTLTARFDKTAPTRAHLRIRQIRAKGGLKIVVGGTIAKGAHGGVSVKASTYLHGRHVTATKRARIIHGRWSARLGLAEAGPLNGPIYVTARFKGSPGVKRGHAKRRITLQ